MIDDGSARAFAEAVAAWQRAANEVRIALVEGFIPAVTKALETSLESLSDEGRDRYHYLRSLGVLPFDALAMLGSPDSDIATYLDLLDHC